MGQEPVTIYGTTDGGHRWALESRSAEPATWPSAGRQTLFALPTGCDKYVGFSTPTEGWATFLCPNGLSPIFGSNDGGRTWGPRRLAPLPALYRLSPDGGFAQWDSPPVFDGEVGAVGLSVDLPGQASLVYRSTDGGDSWRPVVPPGGPRNWSVDIVSGSTWKLVAGRTVLTTTNAGQDWQVATSNLALSAVDRPDFVTARDGWYTPYDTGALYRTTDGGRTWAVVALPSFSGPKLTQCGSSQIAVTVAQLGGAAVTGGLVVRYRNVSPYACTLSGYPTVVGLVSPTGPTLAATDEVSGVLGGWQPNAPGVQEPLPTVVLSAKGGTASSVVEFVTGIGDLLCPSKRYPLLFHSLWLNLPGGTRPFALSVPEVIVCSYFDANPIVPGTTGSAPQVPH